MIYPLVVHLSVASYTVFSRSLSCIDHAQNKSPTYITRMDTCRLTRSKQHRNITRQRFHETRVGPDVALSSSRRRSRRGLASCVDSRRPSRLVAHLGCGQ